MKRPATHLLVIVASLAVLAAAALWYTNSREPVAGLPEKIVEAGKEPAVGDTDVGFGEPLPGTKEACELEGGFWNECGSACPDAPPGTVCIQMCVPRCESLAGAGKGVVKIYFPDGEQGSANDCQQVFPVRRLITAKGGVYRAALEALIEGPNAKEREAGYFTSLPDGVELRSIRVENGTAYADFNEALNRVGGSCRVASIRAQIEATLREFSGVKDVVISVNGDAETALQP